MSTLSFLTPTALYLIHCTGWTYLIWISSTVECVVFCLPAHLSQQALHDQCKGREIMALSRERRRENFLLFQIFFSEPAISVFLIFQGLDLKLWVTESQKCWSEGKCGKSPKSRQLPEEELSSTQDKVSGFVREPWRHRRMDISPLLCSSVALPSRKRITTTWTFQAEICDLFPVSSPVSEHLCWTMWAQRWTQYYRWGHTSTE